MPTRWPQHRLVRSPTAPAPLRVPVLASRIAVASIRTNLSLPRKGSGRGCVAPHGNRFPGTPGQPLRPSTCDIAPDVAPRDDNPTRMGPTPRRMTSYPRRRFRSSGVGPNPVARRRGGAKRSWCTGTRTSCQEQTADPDLRHDAAAGFSTVRLRGRFVRLVLALGLLPARGQLLIGVGRPYGTPTVVVLAQDDAAWTTVVVQQAAPAHVVSRAKLVVGQPHEQSIDTCAVHASSTAQGQLVRPSTVRPPAGGVRPRVGVNLGLVVVVAGTEPVDAFGCDHSGDLTEGGCGSGVEVSHEIGAGLGLVVFGCWLLLFAWPQVGPAVYRPAVFTVQGVGPKHAGPLQDAGVMALVQLA